jgi:hypothetical protein
MDGRDAPDISSFCRELGYRPINRMIVESAKEFLKLLFEFSISLAMENFIDG